MHLGSTFSVYGWGHNHRGQLGGVEGNKVKFPRLCENFSELNPVHMCGGEQTFFAVTSDGKVRPLPVNMTHTYCTCKSDTVDRGNFCAKNFSAIKFSPH